MMLIQCKETYWLRRYLWLNLFSQCWVLTPMMIQSGTRTLCERSPPVMSHAAMPDTPKIQIQKQTRQAGARAVDVPDGDTIQPPRFCLTPAAANATVSTVEKLIV